MMKPLSKYDPKPNVKNSYNSLVKTGRQTRETGAQQCLALTTTSAKRSAD